MQMSLGWGRNLGTWRHKEGTWLGMDLFIMRQSWTSRSGPSLPQWFILSEPGLVSATQPSLPHTTVRAQKKNGVITNRASQSFSLVSPSWSPNPFTLPWVGGTPPESFLLEEWNCYSASKSKPRPLVWVWVTGPKTGHGDGFHLL